MQLSVACVLLSFQRERIDCKRWEALFLKKRKRKKGEGKEEEDETMLPWRRRARDPIEVSCGYYRLAGDREYQEDFISLDEIATTDGHKATLFGCFDGHGGESCSQFMSENFGRFLTSCKDWDSNPKQALVQAFNSADEASPMQSTIFFLP